MSDVESIPTPGSGQDMTTDAFLARSPEVTRLRLRVVDATPIGTQGRLIRLGGDDLATFAYAPGQDLMFLADASHGRIIRRRYTIRRSDAAARTLDVQIATESGGPGARFIEGLRPGDEIEVLGPRGKITLKNDITSYVFVGDDSSAPAIAAMVEALPEGARATVIVEVAGPADEAKIEPAHSVTLDWTWLHRHGRPPGEADALLEAVATAAPDPAGTHAYVFGEAAVVRTVTTALAERGFGAEQTSPKAYWGRGRANASHGEPLKQ